MAKELKYWPIKGRDEEILVFENLSRSVVKRGADKIYWRLKDVREKRFGSWDDGVWLDCETGDVRFGERCVKECWADHNDVSFARDLGRSSYRRQCVYSWYLGGVSEWRGPVAEIEPRLAARLAEAAEFNFGLDFTGPEEENSFLAAANEVARFYETRARLERLAEEADARGEKYWDRDFPETSAEELEEFRRIKDRFDLEDFDPRIFRVPVCWRVETARRDGGSESATQKLIFDANASALVPYYSTRSREIGRRCKAALRKIPARERRARQKAEEYFRRLEDDLNYGFNFDGVRADNFPRLGELDELIAEAQAGTSSEEEKASGEFAPATRSDALSDDWRERLASLLEYRLDRCNALFQAAKALYVEIIGTKVRWMKGLDVWVAPGGERVETSSAGGRPQNASWLKIGKLTEFYEKKRGVYWGSGVKKADKISRKDDARQWLAREIGRRLEAALKAAD